MKRFILCFLLCSCTLFATVEKSVGPLIEQIEQGTNLPEEKLSKGQLAQIQQLLPQIPNRVRIISYKMLINIRDETHSRCYRWPARCPRIVEQIQALRADIIGSQELYEDQLEDILGAIGHEYAFYGKGNFDGKKKGEINGIFYRTDRFTLIDAAAEFMGDHPTRPGPTPYSKTSRTLTWLVLTDTKTDTTFVVMNAHFSFSNPNCRELEARYTADRAAEWAQDYPVIVMGDLNTFPMRLDLDGLPYFDGDYAMRILTAGPLRDAHQQAILGHLGPISTYTNRGTCPAPFQGTGKPGVFLDHILVTDNITVIIEAVDPAKVDGFFPSDHMPVLADILIGNNL